MTRPEVIGGRYRIERVLGEGGMGTVYLATHLDLGRPVAIKTLRTDLASNEEMVERFFREARAAAQVRHPGIVDVFDVGRSDGLAYIAMEILDGEELVDLIAREHPLPLGRITSIGIELCEAVAAAHEAGVVHRDLKPSNVFITKQPDGTSRVKVLDFGVAKLMDSPRSDSLTQTGQIFGTPMYMPPEQLRGAKDIDQRADVYAIGTILHQAAAGRPPFEADTFAELVLKICAEAPPRLTSVRPDVPAAWAAVVARAMAPRADDRHADARSLAAALRAADASVVAALDSTVPALPATRIEVGAPAEIAALTEVERAARSRRPLGTLGGLRLLAGLGALLVLGALAAAWATGARDTNASSAHDALGSTVSAIEGPAAPRSEAPSGAPSSPAPDAEPPRSTEPELERTTLAFDVAPEGVSISVGDAELCRSPCTAELPNVPTTLRFEREGYESAERVLAAPLPSRVSLELRRAPRRAGSREGERGLVLPTHR